MKVAVDSGPLTSGHKVRGVGFYTKGLIEELKRLGGKDIEIYPVDFSNAKLDGYDILHFTTFNPFFVNFPKDKTAKWIITIHDLIPLIYPKNYPPGVRGKIKFIINKFYLSKVDKIIAVSETSKKDIVRLLDIPSQKISVVYPAIQKVFQKLKTGGWKSETKNKYNLPDKFILYVGDVNYNKNIPGLVNASSIANLPLVICGKQAKDIGENGIDLKKMKGPMDWARYVFNKPHPETSHFSMLSELFIKNEVIRLGFIETKDLVKIYNLASVYVQPSFYEGFGLPVLEAFACETPTVITRCNALVEIAQGGAQIADPKDPEDLADKILSLLKDDSLSLKLLRTGKNRLKEFSWEKCAQETINIYKELLL